MAPRLQDGERAQRGLHGRGDAQVQRNRGQQQVRISRSGGLQAVQVLDEVAARRLQLAHARHLAGAQHNLVIGLITCVNSSSCLRRASKIVRYRQGTMLFHTAVRLSM
jgi:hypothetical protein